MINKKKLGIFGASAALLIASAASLASCGGPKLDLTYWCPATDTEIMAEFVKEFKEANPDFANKNIGLLANYGEDQTLAQLQKSLADAADVMLMADDNIRKGVKSADIQVWDTATKNAYVTSDGQDAVDALSINGKLYALPYRGDNSPMFIYDSSVLDANDVKTLEGIMTKAKSKGKKVYMDLGNGWYNAFLLWEGGASLEVVEKNGTEVLYTDAATTKLDATAAFGEKLMTARKAWGDTFVSSSDQGAIESGFAEGGNICGAFFWNDLAAIKEVNANAKVAKWPTFDGNQIDCFASYKGVVVKAELEDETKDLAMAFAKFISNKDCQIKRAEKLGYGPSNQQALESEAVKKLDWVTCIKEMQKGGFTHPQAQSTTGDFWDPIGNYGKYIATQSWGSVGSAKRALQALVGSTGWTDTK